MLSGELRRDAEAKLAVKEGQKRKRTLPRASTRGCFLIVVINLLAFVARNQIRDEELLIVKYKDPLQSCANDNFPRN